MPRRFTKIGIDETSGVDHPAHGVEGWLVMKSADGADTEETVMSNTTTPDLDALPEEVQDFVKSLIAERDEAIANAEQTPSPTVENGEDAALQKALDAMPEEIRKAVESQTESLRKAAESNAAEARRAQELAERERDERLTDAMIAKASDELAAIPVPSGVGESIADLGRFLRRLQRIDDQVPVEVAKAAAGTDDDPAPIADQVFDILKALNGQLETAGLFSELGSELGSGNGSVDGELEAVTKSVKDKDPSLTEEQAFAKALEDNPDLYRRYRESMDA